jgi:hypothetical protein
VPSGAEPRTIKRPASPGVAAGAGNAADFAAFQGAAGDLARRALTLDRDFEPLGHGGDAVLHVDGFAGHDLFFALERIEAGGVDLDLVLAR